MAAATPPMREMKSRSALAVGSALTLLAANAAAQQHAAASQAQMLMGGPAARGSDLSMIACEDWGIAFKQPCNVKASGNDLPPGYN